MPCACWSCHVATRNRVRVGIGTGWPCVSRGCHGRLRGKCSPSSRHCCLTWHSKMSSVRIICSFQLYMTCLGSTTTNSCSGPASALRQFRVPPTGSLSGSEASPKLGWATPFIGCPHRCLLAELGWASPFIGRPHRRLLAELGWATPFIGCPLRCLRAERVGAERVGAERVGAERVGAER